MENKLAVFNNEEFGQVRTVEINGEPWFVGKDVAIALGYKNSRQALQDHVNVGDKSVVSVPDPHGRAQKTVVINEAGLYRLIFRSKLPSADKFTQWVASEVLPSIRQNGGYINNQENLTKEEVLANAVLVAQQVIEKKDAIIEKKTAVIEKLEPKANYFDKAMSTNGLSTIRNTAKYFGIPQNKFVNWLLDNKFIYKDRRKQNIPCASVEKKGWMELKQVKIIYNQVRPQALFTVEGQFEVLKKLRKDETMNCYLELNLLEVQ
ncbi:MAG: BRO family protein [Bacteroidales bacterium]